MPSLREQEALINEQEADDLLQQLTLEEKADTCCLRGLEVRVFDLPEDLEVHLTIINFSVTVPPNKYLQPRTLKASVYHIFTAS